MLLLQYFVVLIAFLSFKPTLANNLIIRVRLQSGAMQRVEVDENTTTSRFLQNLHEKGYSSMNTSYIINKTQYSSINITQGSLIQTFRLKAGDIIELQASSNIHTKSSSTKATKSSSTANYKKSISKKMTLSDLRKYRSSLVKIKNEKASSNRIAAISLSSGRILKRLTQGGIGLVLGRIDESTKLSEHRKRSNMKILSSAGSSSDTPKDVSTQTYEVHAICELETCDGKKSLPWNIKQGSYVESIQKINGLAEKLGLKVIGCSIGIPSTATPIMWSSYHLHILLQLQELLIRQDLIMISVSDKVSDANAQAKTKKKRQSLRDKDLGLSLEAFFLSNQSILLFNTSVFPSIPSQEAQIPLSSTSALSSSSKPDVMLDKLLKVQLAGEVLLQSTESKIVDAILLAVPAAIQPLTICSSPTCPEFEHSFPSRNELEDVKLQTIAKKHVLKILGSSSSPGSATIIHRLRDPHLLLYLSTILDDLSMTALCKALVDLSADVRLPGHIVAALDMIRMVLTE